MVATQFHFFPPRLVFGRQSSNRLIMPQSWAGEGSSFWLLFLIISSQARHEWSHAGSSCWSSPCSSSNVVACLYQRNPTYATELFLASWNADINREVMILASLVYGNESAQDALEHFLRVGLRTHANALSEFLDILAGMTIS